MEGNNYESVLCRYCSCTDYGCESVNTGPWNLCEGHSCKVALDNYLDENPDESENIEDYF